MAKKTPAPDVVLVPVVTIDNDAIHRRLGHDVEAMSRATRAKIAALSAIPAEAPRNSSSSAPASLEAREGGDVDSEPERY